MVFIDSHAHIYLDDFGEDLSKVVEEADKQGVKHIFMPAIDSTTHEQMFRVNEKHSNCHCMIGLHPCSVKDNYVSELESAKKFLDTKQVYAIGETGLDFYWDVSWREQQYKSFQQQIDWAREFDLAIVIHSRESIDECISVVKKNQQGDLKGVFHCFSGTENQAKQIIDLGFFLGIGGVLTYKNSGLSNAIKDIDIKHIILETDSPYLTPVPFRGKRNQPSYTRIVAEKLSEVKNLSLGEIANITTKNTMELFGLLHHQSK